MKWMHYIIKINKIKYLILKKIVKAVAKVVKIQLNIKMNLKILIILMKILINNKMKFHHIIIKIII